VLQPSRRPARRPFSRDRGAKTGRVDVRRARRSSLCRPCSRSGRGRRACRGDFWRRAGLARRAPGSRFGGGRPVHRVALAATLTTRLIAAGAGRALDEARRSYRDRTLATRNGGCPCASDPRYHGLVRRVWYRGASGTSGARCTPRFHEAGFARWVWLNGRKAPALLDPTTRRWALDLITFAGARAGRTRRLARCGAPRRG